MVPQASFRSRVVRRAVGVVVVLAAAAAGVAAPAGAAQGSPAPAARASTGGGSYSLGYGLMVPFGDHEPTPAERAAGTFRPQRVPLSDASGRAFASAPVQTVTRPGSRSTFVINFGGGFTAEAETAFIAAADYWSGQVYSAVPIVIDANWTPLGSGVLGSTGPENLLVNTPGSIGGTAYASALANSLAGYDLDTAHGDMRADFNSAYPNWSFDPTNPVTSKEDFQSVVTHEIAHGLGYIASFGVGSVDGCTAGLGCYSPVPFIFDRFVWTMPSGGHGLLSDPNNSAQLAGDLQPAAASTAGLYWAGRWGVTRAGARPTLYAPSSWKDGSSASHLDESTYGPASGNALMTPVLGFDELERAVGPIAGGMLLDMGWSHLAPNEAFVRALYPSFLGRAVTSDELSFWLPGLQGQSRYQVALTLAASHEWLANIVTGFYQSTLGRAPDPAGLDWWIGEIQAGRQTVASTAANLYGSPEYFASSKIGSNYTTWVDSLYSALLGRSPDGGGQAYWVQQAQQVGRGWVALNFYQSLESRKVRVTSLYQSLLGRAPDGAGLGYWADKVLTDGDLSLAANLAGSAEYLSIAENATLFS